MKIIYFAFKHRYRVKDLNNFLITKKYGNFFVINFSGPLKHYFAKFLFDELNQRTIKSNFTFPNLSLPVSVTK